MDIKQIRAALATALGNVVDASGAHLNAASYVPDSVTPPCAYPTPGDGTYDDSLDGTAEAVVTVRVLTSRNDDRAGQGLLDGYLATTGTASIKKAIEADPTLGGVCSDLQVQSWSGYRMYEIAGTDYYGAELTVVVLA